MTKPEQFPDQPTHAVPAYRVARALGTDGHAETCKPQIVREGIHGKQRVAATTPAAVDAIEVWGSPELVTGSEPKGLVHGAACGVAAVGRPARTQGIRRLRPLARRRART